MKSKRILSILFALLVGVSFFLYKEISEKRAIEEAELENLSVSISEKINAYEESKAKNKTTSSSTQVKTTKNHYNNKTTEKTTKSNYKTTSTAKNKNSEFSVEESKQYYRKNEVALYLHTYKHLPSNYITKNQAKSLGWEGGNVSRYKSGAMIGGDYYGNFEEKLPKKSGRKYYECDVNNLYSSSRGAERIVYSNDGLIYFTSNHYESFVKLYG